MPRSLVLSTSSKSVLQKMKALATMAFGLPLMVLITYGCICFADLQIGYYQGKCSNNSTVDVEAIVKKSIATQYGTDGTIVPALIRLQFHDCFVRGCDASILLDGNSTEKTASPNLTLRGYTVIDNAKTAVEDQCPGVVSCADIIIMAAREAVVLGGGEFYNVTTGRRDGLVSNATEAVLLIPPANISVSNAITLFEDLGINTQDMVTLIGAHTVGVAHCSSFQDRLYNYNNTGKADPTMDKGLLKSLQATCHQNTSSNNTANLDQNSASANTVDKSYFQQIMKNKGILTIDQEIDLDSRTNGTVAWLANNNTIYNTQFGAALLNLGAVNVLLESQGQIRKNCRSINN